MTRLLVECTNVFLHPHVNSGIQRVVRNVIGHLGEVEADVECIPVAFVRGRLYRVLSLASPATDELPWDARACVSLEALREKYWLLHSRANRLWPMNRSHFARRVLYVLSKLGSLAITLPLRVALRVARGQVPARLEPLETQAGDQLLLLDSSWHAELFPLIERLKVQGVGIISVIYDLIPISHPQFFEAGLAGVYGRWFDWISRVADGFLCISATVQEQMRAEITERRGVAVAEQLWFEHFHLGSELDLLDDAAEPEATLQRLFTGQMPVYLMVSTVEPRKNHAYALDAFEQLWAKGMDVRLCIIGRVGWKCEALIERIRSHPELNRRLFMFNQVDDRGLEYAYQHARALLFSSFAEGFGLPLVEAMQRGLPAMASDIPVFREVGSEFMAYFDLAAPASLCALVEQFEQSGAFPAVRPISEWQWPGWREASQQMVDRVLLAQKPKAVQPPAPMEELHADCI